MKATLLGATAALFISGATHAANFDFTDSSRPADGKYSSLSFSSGGVGLTVTPTGNSTKVVSYWEGLGAYSAGADLGTFDDCCVNINAKDQLVFTFDQEVTLSGISFRQWENGFDKVQFTGGGLDFTLSNSNSGAFDLIDYFVFGSPITLQSFTLTALNGSGTATYIHGLEGVAPAVPLPASLWFMGSGLMGLVGLARRRRRG